MKDIIPALSVGLTQVVIGHPFDTAKVLIQNQKKWTGLPIKSYYMGWKYPMFSSVLFNCTMFPVYEEVFKYSHNPFFSGAVAGAIVSPIDYVLDTFKIQKQIECQTTLFKRPYYGILQTFNRQISSTSLYFGTYYYLKERNYNTLVAGGTAGLTQWTLTYPLDVIRSRQIAQQITMKEAINIGNLWKGYSVCAFRAVLVNSATFWIYEKSKIFIS
jgi:hypothetical protein